MASTIEITGNQVKPAILKNALVTFGPGADVLGMLHPSDYSAIRLSWPRSRPTAGQVAMYLHSSVDEIVGVSRIHILTAPDERPAVAHVQVQDPGFAARVQGRFDRYLTWVPRTRVTLAQVPVQMRYESSSSSPSGDPPGLQLQLLKDRAAMIRLRDRPATPDCAVCLTEAEELIQTPCRHQYCRTCFITQCSSITDKDREIPLRCLGDLGTCSRIFLLPELRQPESTRGSTMKFEFS